MDVTTPKAMMTFGELFVQNRKIVELAGVRTTILDKLDGLASGAFQSIVVLDRKWKLTTRTFVPPQEWSDLFIYVEGGIGFEGQACALDSVTLAGLWNIPVDLEAFSEQPSALLRRILLKLHDQEESEIIPIISTQGRIRRHGRTPDQRQVIDDMNSRSDQIRADRQEAIFGFRDIKSVYDIDDHGKYGYAYYDPKKAAWRCYIGSFAWLHGFHTGITSTNDDDSDDESTSVCCWAFFRLDDDLQIVHILPHAHLTMEQNNRMHAIDIKYSSTMRDLYSLGLTLTPPKLIWGV